ncbi:MAG: mannose-1-phosphate guanylyltransferase [Candidatus Krumholzibacteriota bacterium]|nr:mannose-1-phosphate guanylyltransferase [Candidatus Krumholzibacteriota bacterium]
MYAAILAGGRGKRFWPLSREERPKQFIDITGEGTMLSVTYGRISSLVDPGHIFILTVADQVDLVRKELPDLPEKNILSEPVGRNTAPSLALAAMAAASAGDDEPLLCCPSDHIISDTAEFHSVVKRASKIVSEKDLLLTFGVRPDNPSTGYGYIESGDRCDEGIKDLFSVDRFHEKPDRRDAVRYLEHGGYYWNSGIFMWRPSVFLAAWKRFMPDGVEPLSRIADAFGSGRFDDVLGSEYISLPAVSVDYGILEKADNVAVIPVEFGWNDVGSWDALYGILSEDSDGNRGAGLIESIDSKGNIFFNPGGTTAAIGIEDLIVVVDRGTVMVCRKGDSQRVKDLLEKMEQKRVSETS